MKLICFVCEWNEGRSAHLELSARRRLVERSIPVQVISAGLSRGGRITEFRAKYLLDRGIPVEEIESHRSKLFGPEQAKADLVLVAELSMKQRILSQWPQLEGRVMTLKGFVKGLTPETESLTEREAHLEDAGGHSPQERLMLYAELEELAEEIVSRLARCRHRATS